MSEASVQSSQLELAHVMFTDIVAFSKLPMEEQGSILMLLQQLVRGTAEYQRALASDQLISLPTGDGMALVFFGDPESAVRCAQELAAAIRNHPELKLRIGVHSGPVYRVSDINTNRNVTGGGINMAQRVMDCCDAGHILISKTTADYLMQVRSWQGVLHDIGEAEVKHGVKLHLYNLYRDNAGNPRKPSKLRVAVRKKQTHRALAAVSVIVVIAIAIGAYWVRTHGISLSLVNKGARRSIAVLGFKNLSGHPDQAWLSTALTQMMSTELAAGQKLRTVSGESVAQAMMEFAIPDSDSLTPETLGKIKKRLSADLIVLGSYAQVGGSSKNAQLRVDVRLQNTDDGEILLATAEKGGIDNLFDLVTRCGKELRDRLSLGAVSDQQAAIVRASLPSDPEAARLYSEGLQRLRLFDALGARALLEKAAGIEPDNAQTHSALSSAWLRLGYQSKAAEEAKRAFDLSANLPREDHLRVEAQYRLALNDWPRSIEINQALFGFYPDNLEYGLDLANAQNQGGKNDDCLKTIAMLRKMPAPARDDPRIDLLEGRSAETTGDSKRAASANEQAATKAKDMGARLLYAQARLEEGWNYRVLGEFGKAVTLLQEAQQIYEQAGDRAGMARAIGNLGATYASQGNLPLAKQSYEKALATNREIGYTVGVARNLQNLGFTSLNEGNAAQGKAYLEESLATSRSNGDVEAQAYTLLTLSDFYYDSDDPATAKKYAQESADKAHAIGNKRVEAMALGSVAQILADGGDLSGAKATYDRGLLVFRDEGARALIISMLQRLGHVEWSQGDLSAARKHFEEAARIARELGNAKDVALSAANLAAISLDEGQVDAAASALKEVVAELSKQRIAPGELTMPTQYLAEALLAGGKPAEAKKTLESLRDSKGNFPNPVASANYEVAVAQLGDPKPAIAKLQRNLARKDFTEFESRLAVRMSLAKLQLQARQNADARATLEAIQKDADSKGYGLWSQKAARMLKGMKA